MLILGTTGVPREERDPYSNNIELDKDVHSLPLTHTIGRRMKEKKNGCDALL